jgi:hypothetical protein
MTLKRKSLIRARTHLFWYSLALVLSMYYILKVKGAIFCAAVVVLFAFKVKTNINKYAMWTGFVFLYYFIMQRVSSNKSLSSEL